jgi:hypothetical protein
MKYNVRKDEAANLIREYYHRAGGEKILKEDELIRLGLKEVNNVLKCHVKFPTLHL